MTTDAGSIPTRRIIVIQDVPAMIELVRLILTHRFEHLELLGTERGYTGLELAARNRPDLIILDDMLPDVWGGDILQQLKSDSSLRDIPVIMMTAKVEPEYLAQLLELGANDYITVPFSPRELPDMISTLLGWPITLPHGG